MLVTIFYYIAIISLVFGFFFWSTPKREQYKKIIYFTFSLSFISTIIYTFIKQGGNALSFYASHFRTLTR